ncbi:hypothetical protein CRE_21625 [Caenorhabditis remanei]|uniref:DUF19 domain-containing protein n=1 Tax=Caenorhabditis remanei TaxID=31234 RepID=E3NP66_CAERE|nr:hypothetical protein CRE_21625 [Caenorhabditis remanei]
MISYWFTILFPLSVFGQWGTPPPVVTNEQCQAEFDKIVGCFRPPLQFSRIDDIPSFDQAKDQEFVQEITHVLDCSGFLNCNSSRILQSYLFNQRWITDHYYEKLSHCLTPEGFYKIQTGCNKVSDRDCNGLTSNFKCLSTNLKQQPNCEPKDVQPFRRWIFAHRAGCLMMHQFALEIKNYEINAGRAEN